MKLDWRSGMYPDASLIESKLGQFAFIMHIKSRVIDFSWYHYHEIPNLTFDHYLYIRIKSVLFAVLPTFYRYINNQYPIMIYGYIFGYST